MDSVFGSESSGAWIPLNKCAKGRQTLKHRNSGMSDSEYKNWVEQNFGKVPITQNWDRSIRKEGFYFTEDLQDRQSAIKKVQRTLNILSWSDIVDQFEHYLDDKEDLTHVLENNEGDRVYIDDSHRFEESYQKDQMGKMYAIERQAKEKYGEENLKTVMLTFSASPYRDGNLLPPIDHLDSLLNSWDTLRRSLYRVLSDYEFEYMRILEPHTPSSRYETSGYAHMHMGIVVKDENDTLEAQDFKGLLDKHVSNCKTAGSEAHNVNNSVSVIDYEDDKEGGIGGYLTSYMGEKIEEDPRDADRWFKRFLAMLWVSNRRRVNLSQGANEWVKEDRDIDQKDDQDDDTEWEYIGVKKDGELIDCNYSNTDSYLSKLPGGYDNINVTNYAPP